MFAELSLSIDEFATLRNWKRYHHPKNLIINLFVELSELAEHLITERELTFEDLMANKEKMEGIKDEIGDLLINLVHFAKSIKVDINGCQALKPSKDLAPSQIILRITTALRYIAEPLTWISEEQSKSFEATPEMPEIVKEAVEFTLYFADKLNLPPVETALTKMEKIKKKFPVDAIDEDITIFHRNKAKHRKTTY